MKKYYLLVSLVLFLVACSANQNDKFDACLPPSNFTEEDLIGTWKTGTADINDTLIIKGDGTYKQIIHSETPAFDYESDWQPWRLEYAESGLPYLHLEGMRLCVYWEQIDCKLPSGNVYEWYDFCQEKWIKMIDEGILIVVGPDEIIFQSDVRLFSLKIRTEGVTVYRFVEP